MLTGGCQFGSMRCAVAAAPDRIHVSLNAPADPTGAIHTWTSGKPDSVVIPTGSPQHAEDDA